MRFTITLLIFCTIGFTASAQFWQRKPKPPEHPPLLQELQLNTKVAIAPIHISTPNVHDVQLRRSVYNIEAAEEMVLKDAKHNMRFRIYNSASYNFSDLAELYMQQNRFSEAKWYLLQSNEISRQQDDTKHTLSNLLLLATIKIQIGEIALANLDLQEAHDIAAAKGMQTDVAEIDKRIKFLQTNKIATAKVETHYAEAVEIANSKAIIN